MFAMIRMVLILVIIGVVVGGLWYITNLKADLAVSELNNQKLEEATKSQNELIEQMQADIAQIQQINSDLQEQNAKQKKDVDELAKKFGKRDFGSFVATNPEKSQE